MLEKLNPDKHLDGKEYKESINELEVKLETLQQLILDLQIPVVIVLEGWGSSGKGTQIARIVHPLDPRHFNVYTMDKVNEDMAMRPFLWPFWTRMPARGRITVFDKSWHRIILADSREKWRVTHSKAAGFYQDVNAFEKQLTDDGALILKFFLHIGKDEQRKRFKALEKNEDTTAWRVDAFDWEQNHNYEHHLKQYEKMLNMTDTDENPWHIIEANDRKFATVKIYKTIIERIEARADSLRSLANAGNGQDNPPPPYTGPRFLRHTTPDKPLTDDSYKKELEHYQHRLQTLGNRLYAKRRPVVILYEGWDAAGKGGNIKRLTEQLDPRCYEVVPIGAPTQDELARHYLWRFYNKLPKDGHFTIFDRTWYGRVLVERVERLTPEPVWRRAYREINEMETHLHNHGAVIFKFWLHIDQDEQLRRFEARQEIPLKQYKITDEDWRNREKWGQYEDAADEMIAETGTPHAPWTIIESNNKKYARLKVLRTITEKLAETLV